nr:putative integron gene cassette protein [uncultured bacterium]
MKYQEIPELSPEEIETALTEGHPLGLEVVVLSAVLHSSDSERAQDICIALSSHPNPNVRGNAVLGLGHLARIHGFLNQERALPVVIAALADHDPYVAGQAESAADDITHFLGWEITP